MKKRLPFSNVMRMLAVGVMLCGSAQSVAQLSLTGSSYNETFDGISTALPTGWTVRATATAVTRGTALAFATAANTWADTGSGFKNLASSDGLASGSSAANQNASSDRALGVKQSGSFGDPGAAFELALTNTQNRTGFSLTLKHQMLSVQPRTTTWTVQYAVDGGSGLVWTNLGTYTDPGTFGSTTGNYSFGTALDNISGNVLIRIVALTASGGTGTRDTYGIDDFVLSWTNATVPDLAVSSGSLTYGTLSVGTASGSQTFNLSGTNLTGAPGTITVSAPNTDFQVSNDNISWGASASIAYNSATLAATPVYARFTPQSSGAKSGNITFSGGGDATPPTVTLSGNGVLEAPVATAASNVKNTEFTAQWQPVSGATSYRLDVSSTPFASIGSIPWINEFHYDNIGTDVNEFVEMILPATYAGTGFTLTFYNGSNGASYSTVNLAQMVAGESNALYTIYTYTFPAETFQNGAPDGLALSDASGLIQFISYEGSFTATNGPANGMVSVEINPALSESNTTLATASLALSGSGTSYSSFTWGAVNMNSKGALNAGQTIGSATYIIQDQNVGNNTSYTVTGLNPDTPYYYRVRAIDANGLSVNSNTISVSTTAETTWDGLAWSDGSPTASLNAIIEGAFDTATDGVFTAKSLTINAGGSVTINSGTNITVVNQVTNTLTAADLVVENNANLLQLGIVNVNSGEATVYRNASMRRQDYVYWSSPVAGQNLLDFSPNTLTNRFYELNETSNSFAPVNPETTDFIAAKGFMVRAPNDFPATPQIFSGRFIGVPNSGSYSIAVTNNNQGYNMIGNPYPSTISADAFLDQNVSVGTIYFWTHTNQDAGPGDNYATYNATGQVAPSSTTPQSDSPNGAIQTGQGFIVQTNTATNIEFLNTMRIPDNNDQFFRTASSIEKNRIWLNLMDNTSAAFLNQILVGYVTGATNDNDLRFDGRMMPSEGARIYSVMPEGDYVIQGRALPFNDNDVVALGFRTPEPGTFSIGLDHLDGIFYDSQDVFLHDNVTGATINIKEGDYQFASNAGEFLDRFQLVYQSAPLGINPVFDENAIVIYSKDDQLTVNTGIRNMESVKVFDISGRLLLERTNLTSAETVLDNLSAKNQLLLVQVTDEDGVTVTKKAMY
ncbi:hypothetical protein HYN48_08180 [Flavobacterium magnum]|uniref:Fibronectin type-III domain-containing protein n=1 Tax=Flavobacterium magnum TaxID=2162713 RepID=A0A2S0RFN9_9FLAO|nr:T9SS sorting signal type C domain-containing protein [Flavobacterium magnum]AWA30058.1 hypothetical protein HYN48_08180 [Flavobacterium magnum]